MKTIATKLLLVGTLFSLAALLPGCKDDETDAPYKLFVPSKATATAEYNTISGLILDELEHIPHSGEYLQWECFRLEVVDMDGARIDKVLATMIDTSDNKNK